MSKCNRCGEDKQVLDSFGICEFCANQMADDIRVTDFNKGMSKDERNYHGEEYNENR